MLAAFTIRALAATSSLKAISEQAETRHVCLADLPCELSSFSPVIDTAQGKPGFQDS
jgi:hypothetical protein